MKKKRSLERVMGRGLFLWIKVFWANPILPNQLFRTFSAALRNASSGNAGQIRNPPLKNQAPAIWRLDDRETRDRVEPL
jgi:hypothetical protein